jgi:uncharacterized membrane protein YfcA
MSIILIGLIFCRGFFIESIIGFGGTLVAFAILGFFFDIKELILIGIFIATCASIFVIASDYKAFNQKIFLHSFLFCLPGTILGGIFFVHSSSRLILVIFALFLMIMALKVLFFDKIAIPQALSKLILFSGGVSQGLFGIGGPFFALALKSQFTHKSQLRATLAGFFISFNILRIIQLMLHDNFNPLMFLDYWWVPLPLGLAIYLGHKVHNMVSERGFANLIGGVALFSGIEFFFKS